MLMSPKTNNTQDKNSPRKNSRDIVNRHLSDINDKISEEDILKVNTTHPIAEHMENDDLDKDETISEKDNDGKVSTPWNMTD